MPEFRMGRTQMKIMQVLWKKKRATAQEITNELNKQETVAHSTVQTFLRILMENDAVAHDIEGRTFVYYPLLKKNAVMLDAVKDFVENIFTGSPEGAISYIIKTMDVPDDELERIKRLIDDKGKK